MITLYIYLSIVLYLYYVLYNVWSNKYKYNYIFILGIWSISIEYI